MKSATKTEVSPPEAAARPRRMLDRYEILAEIARGGMGTVYLARLGGAGGFERLFAIKLMHEHLAEDDTFVAMLLDEARTAAHIHHPNAVGIIDVRESAVGYYLVMNYVDGFSLAQILDHPTLDPKARVRIGTRLIADAAHGLHAAHTAKSPQGQRLGIVHRDVSPQNVLVGTDGMGRIVDFGIALAASRIAASRPGMLKGKPSYMAPEQARGDACDARADVFALGIVLWETLVRDRLFYSDMDLATLVKVMECVVEPPTKRAPQLPEALSDVTMKALQKEPGDRFATARDFGVAIERAAEAAGMLATAHEVEEVLGELFADEIATRQEALSRRLADGAGEERPLDRAGLASITRLVPRVRRDAAADDASDAERSGSGELPSTRLSRPGPEIRSGVRESSTPRTPAEQRAASAPAIDAHAPTRASDRPGPISTIAPAPVAAASRPPTAMVIAIVVATAALAGAAGLLFGGEEPAAETPVPAAAADPDPIASPDPDPGARVAEDPGAAGDPAEVADPAAVAAPATIEEVAEPAATIEPAPAAAPDPARAPRTPRARRPDPSTAAPAEGPRSPVVETNPYLTH